MFKLHRAVKLEQYFSFDDITTFYTAAKVTYNRNQTTKISFRIF